MVGCRRPISKPLPPSTTRWSMDTFCPTTEVCPITMPVAWSSSSPWPRLAAGWMSTAGGSDGSEGRDKLVSDQARQRQAKRLPCCAVPCWAALHCAMLCYAVLTVEHLGHAALQVVRHVPPPLAPHPVRDAVRLDRLRALMRQQAWGFERGRWGKMQRCKPFGGKRAPEGQRQVQASRDKAKALTWKPLKKSSALVYVSHATSRSRAACRSAASVTAMLGSDCRGRTQGRAIGAGCQHACMHACMQASSKHQRARRLRQYCH